MLCDTAKGRGTCEPSKVRLVCSVPGKAMILMYKKKIVRKHPNIHMSKDLDSPEVFGPRRRTLSTKATTNGDPEGERQQKR